MTYKVYGAFFDINAGCTEINNKCIFNGIIEESEKGYILKAGSKIGLIHNIDNLSEDQYLVNKLSGDDDSNIISDNDDIKIKNNVILILLKRQLKQYVLQIIGNITHLLMEKV